MVIVSTLHFLVFSTRYIHYVKHKAVFAVPQMEVKILIKRCFKGPKNEVEFNILL